MTTDPQSPGVKELYEALNVIVAFTEDSRARLIMLERSVQDIENGRAAELEISKGADW